MIHIETFDYWARIPLQSVEASTLGESNDKKMASVVFRVPAVSSRM